MPCFVCFMVLFEFLSFLSTFLVLRMIPSLHPHAAHARLCHWPRPVRGGGGIRHAHLYMYIYGRHALRCENPSTIHPFRLHVGTQAHFQFTLAMTLKLMLTLLMMIGSSLSNVMTDTWWFPRVSGLASIRPLILRLPGAFIPTVTLAYTVLYLQQILRIFIPVASPVQVRLSSASGANHQVDFIPRPCNSGSSHSSRLPNLS